MDSKQKPRQGGGLMQTWQNPDKTYRRMFLKLALNCDPDPYPGVVIVSDVSHSQVFVAEVQNLQKDLPQLLKRIKGEAVAYWDLEMDAQKRKEILLGLTSHPLFVG
jgi:hypothetical protein